MFNLITFLFPCLCPENTIPSSLPRIKLFTDSPGNASDVTETGRDCFAVNSRKSLKMIINYVKKFKISKYKKCNLLAFFRLKNINWILTKFDQKY